MIVEQKSPASVHQNEGGQAPGSEYIWQSVTPTSSTAGKQRELEPNPEASLQISQLAWATVGQKIRQTSAASNLPGTLDIPLVPPW
jgi:hypothetical protein